MLRSERGHRYKEHYTETLKRKFSTSDKGDGNLDNDRALNVTDYLKSSSVPHGKHSDRTLEFSRMYTDKKESWDGSIEYLFCSHRTTPIRLCISFPFYKIDSGGV